jgi:hypothetical protein
LTSEKSDARGADASPALGGGKGGACVMPRPRPPSSATVNDHIRRASRLARSFAIPGGVSLDAALDDLLGTS